MRTRRSWRNQDRLYKAIGRDLQRAAVASAAQAAPEEARAILAELHAMTQKDAPPLDCPFTLTSQPARRPEPRQASIFEGQK